MRPLLTTTGKAMLLVIPFIVILGFAAHATPAAMPIEDLYYVAAATPSPTDVSIYLPLANWVPTHIVTLSPTSTSTPSLTATATPTPGPIVVEGYSYKPGPNLDTMLEEGLDNWVLVRGVMPQFYVNAHGGDGALEAKWDVDGDGKVDFEGMGPFTVDSLERNRQYRGNVVVTDGKQAVALPLDLTLVGMPEVLDYRFGAHENFSWWHPEDKWDAVLTLMQNTG